MSTPLIDEVANGSLAKSFTASSKKGKSRAKTFVTEWFRQRGITVGEVRLVPTNSEHRRFMLLSGGQSLILGMSLNSIDKNETARLEPDTEDRPFFDSVWASATML